MTILHSKIDIGGIAIPREELAAVLPDLERFDVCLTDALAIDFYMRDHDGKIPGYVQNWSSKYLSHVIETLKEIGSLREQLSETAIKSNA